MIRSSRIRTTVLTLALSILTIGCASAPIRFEAPSAPMSAGARGREVKAGKCGFQLFLLIPIRVNSRQSRAYDAVKAKAGADILTDIRVRESWFYGFVGTGYCTEITGTAFAKG